MILADIVSTLQTAPGWQAFLYLLLMCGSAWTTFIGLRMIFHDEES